MSHDARGLRQAVHLLKHHTFNLTGSSALITGAASGIGAAISMFFAYEGCRLTLVDRNAAALEETKQHCVEIGSQVVTVAADLTNANDLQRCVDTAVLNFGTVDILVNNAGVLDGQKPAYEANVGDWTYALATNLLAPMQLTRLALPHMLRPENASRLRAVLFMGSGLSRRPHARESAYVSSKFGLYGFAESVFEDVRDAGIKVAPAAPPPPPRPAAPPGRSPTRLPQVVTISPGYVATPMTQHAGKAGHMDLAQLVKPEDVARTAVHCLTQPPNVCITEVEMRPQRHAHAAGMMMTAINRASMVSDSNLEYS
eukprot:tig00001033_g6482.t1